MPRIVRGKKKRQYINISIQVAPDTVTAVEQLAAQAQCSRSTIIRQFIAEGLKTTASQKG